MIRTTALNAVTKCVTAGAYDRSVHLEAIYLFSFQIGIMPANTFRWANRVPGCFLFAITVSSMLRYTGCFADFATDKMDWKLFLRCTASTAMWSHFPLDRKWPYVVL